MHTEIERKFLVADESWRSAVLGLQKLRDGLLARLEDGNVRVRLPPDLAWITVKGPHLGLRRAGYEHQIPPNEAEEMLRTLCTGPLVEKTRHYVADGSLICVVDTKVTSKASCSLRSSSNPRPSRCRRRAGSAGKSLRSPVSQEGAVRARRRDRGPPEGPRLGSIARGEVGRAGRSPQRAGIVRRLAGSSRS